MVARRNMMMGVGAMAATLATTATVADAGGDWLVEEGRAP